MNETPTGDVISSVVPITGIHFLGIAERAAYVREGESNTYKWNVMGLKNVVFTHMLPFSLCELCFGFAIPAETLFGRDDDLQFRIVHESGADAGTITLRKFQPPAPSNDPSVDFEGVFLQGLPVAPGTVAVQGVQAAHSMIIFANLPTTPPLVASLPGNYEIRQVEPPGEIMLGRFYIAVVDAEPLSTERIAAIRSDPAASKAVRIELGCRFCDSKYRAYASLEKSAEMESAGCIWYADVPDSFVCNCGKTNMPLIYIRKNLQAFLGTRPPGSTDAKFTPLYERGVLSSLRTTFSKLVEQSPLEERVQQFLRDNPILFHQFAPVRLFLKPAILTRYHADFAVLTPKKELVLIEIEQPGLRLMNKDGGIAAPLSHAFDQVYDWLQHADDHRMALLDSLNIKSADVSAIRGAVIAGRDGGYDALHLRRLKGVDRGKIEFYTFDDILFGFGTLCENIEKL